MVVLARDHGKGLRFATGAGRAGNADRRKHRSLRLAKAPVVLHPSAVREHEVRALRAVHRGAAAQTDQEVRLVEASGRRGRRHMALPRVLSDAVEHRDVEARVAQRNGRPMHVARRGHARIGHDENPPAAKLPHDLADQVDHPGAVEHPPRRGVDAPRVARFERSLASLDRHDQVEEAVLLRPDREHVGTGGDVDPAVLGHRRRVDGRAHVLLGEDLLFAARLEHDDVAVLVAEVDLAVRDERGTPDRREGVVGPEVFAGLDIQHVEEAAQIRDVDQTVRDRGGRDGPVEVVVAEVPDRGAVRRVAFHVRVEGIEVARAFTVFGILADPEVELVVVEDRRRDHVVPGARSAEFPDRVLRVQIELPQQGAGRRFVGVEPAVAAREGDLRLAVDDAVRE